MFAIRIIPPLLRKGGNKVQVVLETVMVEDPVLQEITLLPSAAYTEEGSYEKNVHPSATVESLVSQFANTFWAHSLCMIDHF